MTINLKVFVIRDFEVYLFITDYLLTYQAVGERMPPGVPPTPEKRAAISPIFDPSHEKRKTKIRLYQKIPGVKLKNGMRTSKGVIHR